MTDDPNPRPVEVPIREPSETAPHPPVAIGVYSKQLTHSDDRHGVLLKIAHVEMKFRYSEVRHMLWTSFVIERGGVIPLNGNCRQRLRHNISVL